MVTQKDITIGEPILPGGCGVSLWLIFPGLPCFARKDEGMKLVCFNDIIRNMRDKPILYSFRRCPYAMRARMALIYSGLRVALHEVDLKNKPTELLVASPKGTVPVLVLADGTVLDESIDIMRWALAKNDPEGWWPSDHASQQRINAIIVQNDNEFTPWLRKYKYADRCPEHSAQYYFDQCAIFLQRLENDLAQQRFLSGENVSLVDIAILPFIRQFSLVDQDTFKQSEYRKLQQWLSHLLSSSFFIESMLKAAVNLEGGS